MAGLRLALAGLLGAAAVSCPWWLAARAGSPRPVRLAGVSTGMAARLARAAAGGQVLSVAPTARNGRTVFQARVRSPDGRVWTVEVDGEDGRVEKQPWEPSPAGSSPAGTRPANPAPVPVRPGRTSARAIPPAAAGTETPAATATAAPGSPGLSLPEAATRAVQAVGGGVVLRVHAEGEDGGHSRVVARVLLPTGQIAEVTLDAGTGAVARIRLQHDR